MLTMFIVMGLIIFVGWLIARGAKEVPGRGQSLIEMIIEFLMGLVEASAGKRLGRHIFPLVSGLFIFILISNYSGLLPGVGTVGFWHEETAEEAEHSTDEEDIDPSTTTESEAEREESTVFQVFDIAATGPAAAAVTAAPAEEGAEEGHHKVLVPYFRAPNADLNMTLAMALVTFTAVQILGIKAHGVGGRIKHMANPPFLFPIELISEFSRIISLSARLFGNVFAGEVLLGVMYAMGAAIKIAVIPFFFPVIFLFLEVMFGAIQALVFALLTLIYIALAAEGGHDEHEAHEHAAAGHGHGHGVQPASGHAD
jgi:F-type H+-transporting ATPase subunit a